MQNKYFQILLTGPGIDLVLVNIDQKTLIPPFVPMLYMDLQFLTVTI